MNDILLRACRGQAVPRTPVWIMRQSGRCLPRFRKILEKTDFLTMCKSPDIAAEVSILPVDALGVDAAILFSDILTTVEPMGMRLLCPPGVGPFFDNPVRSADDVASLQVPEPEDGLGFVMETIRLVTAALSARAPLIGFAGAPFTVAAYMVEGDGVCRSEGFSNARRMLAREPARYEALIEKITVFTAAYLQAQIRAGASAVMLFDSRAELLCPRDYLLTALPAVKRCIGALEKKGVPVIYYINGCAGVLPALRDCGADVIGVGSGVDLHSAVRDLGPDLAIQGNLDPFALFMARDRMEKRVAEVLSGGVGARGHIFNLGGGLHSQTPLDSIVALVDAVKRLSLKQPA